MKKHTRAELEERCIDLSARESVLQIGLNAVMRDQAEYIGHAGDYRVWLCDPRGAHGGVVLETFAPAGQKPCTEARYLEKWSVMVCELARIIGGAEYHALAGLAGKAERARNAACEWLETMAQVTQEVA